ncbi:hypothetical protein CP8484711_1679, partial [Chlamydia psittaci 84-8471/1]
MTPVVMEPSSIPIILQMTPKITSTI